MEVDVAVAVSVTLSPRLIDVRFTVSAAVVKYCTRKGEEVVVTGA